MSTISLQEFQRNPSAWIERVQAGEHLLVIRDGDAVAELRPIASARSVPRPFGLCAGAFKVPDDFDTPLPEDVLREFEAQ